MINNLEHGQQSPMLLSICKEIRTALKQETYNKSKDRVNAIEKQLENKEALSSEVQFFILSTLAKYYKKAKNYDKAGNYSRQAIRLSKNVQIEQMETIIDTYLDYAALEMEYGQLSAARMELAKLLAFLDSKEHQDPYSYGLIFRSLGKVSLKEENVESGIKQLDQALDYFKRAVPETHPVIQTTIQILSDAHIQVESYDHAIELYEHMRHIHNYENDKVSESKTLLKLGEIYFYIDLKEARKTLTRAIKLMAEIYEGNHLDIANAILMLAEIDENMGNFPRAINYYKQALDQLTSFYHEEHFMIVYVYSKIGTISIKLFKLRQAKEYLEKGLALSANYPKIRLQFLYALGKIYSDKKEYDKAFTVFSQFLEMLEKDGRTKSIAYGNTLQAIAFNYLQQDHVEEAFAYYEQALGIYEKLSNCIEEKGLTCIRLAYCYENILKKDTKKAENYYEKGFKLLEKTRNQDLLDEALAGIIDFFIRNHNPKKRKIYENKFVKRQTAKQNN
ncbi:tetratricopeptide repeat protein [Oceanobacillus bengalensis]|uniref:Tetratricopeptide repeat protein n=1 Tax=Oceanobacillus bengalensis TaxID=1435466 RepID=A0A494Z515_9BACI|nr:tetratricopeptide repeat protein [Oceanobacillus bengalensis]RKQ17574.1 tetratricopeptide repeat protein [Oceanobacillus bengalensis]